MCIMPTRVRTLDDWPEAIKNSKTELPDELKPHYVWQDYLFFLYEFTEDTDHPENVGLYMLQVIKAEDRETQFDGGQNILCAGIYHPEDSVLKDNQ